MRMKLFSFRSRPVWTLLALAVMRPAVAQDANAFPTVTISATDSHASEGGSDTGTFTVRRTGPTNFPVAVFYQLSGSASNGVDYERLGSSVQIPAGASEASFIVKPIDDTLAEGNETVVAQLTGSPLACAACGYNIGVPSNAVVTIADNDLTNLPPSVAMLGAQNGPVFTAPVNVLLVAQAVDPEDGNQITVEFFDGTNSIGLGAFNPTRCAAMWCGNFSLTWSNVPPGVHVLTAKATDSSGASSASDPIQIIVYGGVNIYATDPDASEKPGDPSVDPSTGWAIFTVRRFGETSEDIVVYYEISGTASNGVDYLRLPGQVNLPAGVASARIVVRPLEDNLIEGTETVVLTLLPTCPQCLFIYPACLPPVTTNCYPIGPDRQAVAYIRDNDQTNAPPVVNIVARDPFASEGTNFWLRDGNANHWSADLCNLWHVNVGGTNTATFIIRRHGPTNSDLTVNYSVAGTASNGVDYVTLPGWITIAAGKHTAPIVVRPIDDSTIEGIETVALTLLPSADYAVGFPSRAAAIIIDNDRPRPPCVRLRDGLFHLCGPATNGFCFRVETSGDLRNWIPVCTNIVTDGALHFVDPDAASLQHRFYRVNPEPAVPSDD